MDWLQHEWVERGLGLVAKAEEPSAAELVALEEGALLVPLPDSGLLRLTGSDRIDFLHGQLSNDVRGLRSGRANRSLLLNHKGHALAQMSVLRSDEELHVIVESGGLEAVEESLRRHIIFDQVELVRQGEAVVLTLQGPVAGAALGEVLQVEAPEAGYFAQSDYEGSQILVVASERTLPGGYDLIASQGSARPFVEALLEAGVVPGGRPALELARVKAGIASAAGEAGDGVLPQEAGLEPLVSYRKGCYLGQEIMARIEARGKLRRELACVQLAGEPAEGERDLVLEGKRVGRLGPVVRDPEFGYLALAVLRSDLAEGAELEVADVKARQLPLPIDSTPVTN